MTIHVDKQLPTPPGCSSIGFQSPPLRRTKNAHEQSLKTDGPHPLGRGQFVLLLEELEALRVSRKLGSWLFARCVARKWTNSSASRWLVARKSCAKNALKRRSTIGRLLKSQNPPSNR